MSNDEARKFAREVRGRVERRLTLHAEIQEQDMGGLECPQTVELELLDMADTSAAPRLADYVLEGLKLEKKDVVLTWLRRHERALLAKVAEPTQTAMAEQGVPYVERSRVIAQAQKNKEESKVELASLQAAIKFIEEHAS